MSRQEHARLSDEDITSRQLMAWARGQSWDWLTDQYLQLADEALARGRERSQMAADCDAATLAATKAEQERDHARAVLRQILDGLNPLVVLGATDVARICADALGAGGDTL